MNLILKNKKLVAAVTLTATLLTGCSTINPYNGQTQTSDATIGTGIGAIGGATIGAIAGGGKGALIGGALGALTGGLIGNTMDKENEELRARLVGTGVQVEQHGRYIQLVMASDVTFRTNQASINPNFFPTLSSVATVLRKYNGNNIIITGYTDNVGGDSYNQMLSEQRAASVAGFLASQGVAPGRIITVGKGKSDPIASNATAAGRAMNRRVVVILQPGQ